MIAAPQPDPEWQPDGRLEDAAINFGDVEFDLLEAFLFLALQLAAPKLRRRKAVGVGKGLTAPVENIQAGVQFVDHFIIMIFTGAYRPDLFELLFGGQGHRRTP